VGKLVDRLTGKNELAPDAVEAIRLWAHAAQQLTRVLELGSIISLEERHLLIGVLRMVLDTPAPPEVEGGPSAEVIDALHALEQRLISDELRAEQYARELAIEPEGEAI
jgi:hypothetical protein